MLAYSSVSGGKLARMSFFSVLKNRQRGFAESSNKIFAYNTIVSLKTL